MKKRRFTDEELLEAVRDLEWRISRFDKRGQKVSRNMKRRVWERDKGRCRRCGSAHNLTVHHVLPRRDGGKNTMANLTTLCERCHQAHHSADHATVLASHRAHNAIARQAIAHELTRD